MTQQNFHFGHHQTTLCVSDDKAHQQSSADSHTQTANDQFELGEDHQDHQDHLPSMAHLIIPKEINYQMPLAFEVRERPQFFGTMPIKPLIYWGNILLLNFPR
ncbi:hypothetical protein LZ086_04750 [Acinetobacter johnsonii]|nr:hypothetical protein LZ086_04750 [Acinetobacter johnsonii]